MSIVIGGGVYHENCLSPSYIALLGSGGRASVALTQLSTSVALHAFYPAAEARDAELALSAYGVTTTFYDSSNVIGFDYFHPLSSPRIYPIPLPVTALLPKISGEVVLRFGCLEGSFSAFGKRVIYDPQSGARPEYFRENGSQAEELALVLNHQEAQLLTGQDDPSIAAGILLERERARIVVLKMGASGARVFELGKAAVNIPAYRAKTINKIGSGDIFSAVFAHFWGECGLDVGQAADIASRYTSKYVEDRCLPLQAAPPGDRQEISGYKSSRIYLGGPFFTTPQIWMIEEARSGLLSLGAEIFSPMHEIGFGRPGEVARADLEGLDGCGAMLALLAEPDPGTLFEIGYARARGIPVVVFAQAMRDQDPTMLIGTDCEIVSDFATSLYHVVWARES